MAALKESMGAKVGRKSEARCGSGWASSRKGKPDRELRGHGPAHAARHIRSWRMSEFIIIGTFVVSTLVGVVIYLLLGTVRAALASHDREE